MFKFTFFPFAHRHKWSKWQDEAVGTRSGIVALQKSTCAKCNKIKRRRLWNA